MALFQLYIDVGAKTIDDKIAAENQLSSALAGLKITLEAYPDLKANQNFLQLQEEIADVENKLAAVRRYFNSATKEYNNPYNNKYGHSFLFYLII